MKVFQQWAWILRRVAALDASPNSSLASGIELYLRRGWEGPVTSPTAYQIERREFGAPGANPWQAINPAGGTRQNVMTDTTAVAGKWYEYRLPGASDRKRFPRGQRMADWLPNI